LICTGDLEALAKLESDVAALRRVATLKKPFSVDELLTALEQLTAREPA
jgi:hypothetical protein